MFYLLCKNYTKCSTTTVGAFLNQDHATVIYGRKTIANLIETDKEIEKDFEALNNILTGYQQPIVDTDKINYALNMFSMLLGSPEIRHILDSDVISDLSDICNLGVEHFEEYKKTTESQN